MAVVTGAPEGPAGLRKRSPVRRPGVRGDDSGQALAELAVTLPLLSLLALGIIQIALLGYGSVVARYAAFTGARAAAVAPVHHRNRAASQAIDGVVDCFPGLKRDETSVKRTVLKLSRLRSEVDIEFAQGRMTLAVRLKVPRVLPFPPLDSVTAKCAMPMEPVFP